MASVIKRHLNWTLLIGVMLIETPLIWYLLISGENPTETEPIFWSIIGGTVVFELLLEAWYLHQKKRSLFYLLLNFVKPLYIPVGFIILLALSNKREIAVKTEAIPTLTDPR